MLRNVVGGGLHDLPIEGDGLNQVSVLEAHLMLQACLDMGLEYRLTCTPMSLSLLACSNNVLSLANLPNTEERVHMSKKGTPGTPAPGTAGPPPAPGRALANPSRSKTP